MGQPLALPLEQIAEICRLHHVRRLSIFGSATTNRFDPKRSDADFYVEFIPGAAVSFRRYHALQQDLEGLLGRPVDLVMSRALQNPYFAETFAQTEHQVYAA